MWVSDCKWAGNEGSDGWECGVCCCAMIVYNVEGDVNPRATKVD